MKQMYNEEAIKSIMLSERIDKQYDIIRPHIIVAIIVVILCVLVLKNYFGMEKVIGIIF